MPKPRFTATQIRANRKRLRQTLAQAAKEIGVSLGVLWRWEAGVHSPRSLLVVESVGVWMARSADGGDAGGGPEPREGGAR